MTSKRSIWIAEILIGAIIVVAMFTGHDKIAYGGLVAIAATLDKLVDR